MILKATGLSKSFPIENMEPQHVLKNIQLTINKGGICIRYGCQWFW